VNLVEEKLHVGAIDGTVACTGSIDLLTGQVDAIFVRPDVMGVGIGARLLDYLETIAIDSGLKRLTLDSTLNAAPFYRKRGFVGDQIRTYQSPRGILLPCIPMAKDIHCHRSLG